MRRTLASVYGSLAAERIRCCLIGGLAVAAHGIVRATEDIDFLIHAGDYRQKADALRQRLTEAGLGVEVHEADVDDPIGDVVKVSGPVMVDLICTRYDYEYRWLEEGRFSFFPVLGMSLPVLNPAELIVLKLRAGGPQDLYDVAGILAVSGDRLDLTSLDDAVRRYGLDEPWRKAREIARHWR